MSSERRAFPRIESEINAAILINKSINGAAKVRDLSAGGLAFSFDGDIAEGDHIIAHLDGGARLEGCVSRLFKGGFAIALSLSEFKRGRLLETLERASARGRSIGKLALERRIAKRVAGMSQSVVCETATARVPARIIDMSLTGVAIETEAPLELDAMVTIGKMRGTVVRREGNRFGVRFLCAEDGVETMKNMSVDRRRA